MTGLDPEWKKKLKNVLVDTRIVPSVSASTTKITITMIEGGIRSIEKTETLK